MMCVDEMNEICFMITMLLERATKEPFYWTELNGEGLRILCGVGIRTNQRVE